MKLFIPVLAALAAALSIFADARFAIHGPLGPALPVALADDDEDEDLTDLQREVRKPVKVLIGAIRQSKDDLAAQQIAYLPMCKTICGKAWADLTEAERTEFVDGFAFLLRRTSFPKVRELFAKAETALHFEYDPPVVDEAKGEARMKSLIVVHSKVKKDEIEIEYVLVKQDGKWLVHDTVNAQGESTLEGIRTEQVEPMLEDGGKEALLEALREKVAEVKKQTGGT